MTIGSGFWTNVVLDLVIGDLMISHFSFGLLCLDILNVLPEKMLWLTDVAKMDQRKVFS